MYVSSSTILGRVSYAGILSGPMDFYLLSL